jgi:hypothetical protein
MASENPDFVLIAGDLVEGEWFKDPAKRKIFEPLGNDAERLAAWTEGSYYYGHYVNEWFLSRGMEPIGAIGDHEYGDNDWGTSSANTKLIPAMRTSSGAGSPAFHEVSGTRSHLLGSARTRSLGIHRSQRPLPLTRPSDRHTLRRNGLRFSPSRYPHRLH